MTLKKLLLWLGFSSSPIISCSLPYYNCPFNDSRSDSISNITVPSNCLSYFGREKVVTFTSLLKHSVLCDCCMLLSIYVDIQSILNRGTWVFVIMMIHHKNCCCENTEGRMRNTLCNVKLIQLLKILLKERGGAVEASNKVEMTEKVSREKGLTDNQRMPNRFLHVQHTFLSFPFGQGLTGPSKEHEMDFSPSLGRGDYPKGINSCFFPGWSNLPLGFIKLYATLHNELYKEVSEYLFYQLFLILRLSI